MGQMLGGMGGAGAGAGAGAISPQLAALFNSEQFAAIAQRMRENPNFYPEFLQRAQVENPAMF